MKYLSITFLLLIGQLIWSQTSKNYDLIHLEADIKIEPVKKSVSGKVVYQLRLLKNVDSIRFDAPAIVINKVKTGCLKTNFKQTGNLLIINKKFKKNKTYKISIWYRAQPKKAMYFTGWNNHGRKQVWTQGQGKNNSHWLPVNDDQNDKFAWHFDITGPKNYQIISNGIETKNEISKDTRTTSFEQALPTPAYLIFIGIGQYHQQKFTAENGIPVYNYQYLDHVAYDKTYTYSKQIFDFLSNEIPVAYPWANYKQIPCRDFLYGGMENVSATSFNGDRYVVDSLAFTDVNFVNVSAHELAHQWFGDMVTGKTSDDHWLHEGFATYYARMVDQAIFGKAYNDYNVYNYDRQIIQMQNTDTIPLHRPNASSLTYYQKGARIVQMLRQKIGDKTYQQLIQTYLSRYKFKNAGITDFQHLVYEVYGDSLTQFFNRWFEHQAIPEFELKLQKDSLIFVKNTQNLPLDFLIISKDSTYHIQTAKNFKLIDYQHIKTIIANPGNAFLYDINFSRSKSYIKQQILEASAFIDRYQALLATNKWTNQEKDTIFEQLIQRNEYFPVYKEIIRQISTDLTPAHLIMLQKLFKKDLKTRQQIALYLKEIPSALKNDFKSLIKDASYTTRMIALWKYWQNFENEQVNILTEAENLPDRYDKSFRLTWLSLALMTPNYKEKQKPAFANEIIRYAAPDYNMLIRLNAFEMLINLQIITPGVIDYLIDAAFHFNWRMHQPARKYLKQLYQNINYRILINEAIKKLPVKQQKTLFKIIR